MSPQELSQVTQTLVAYPLAVIVVALAVAVVYLFRRFSDLEKEFRAYSQKQGAETAALLDRATKALERIEAIIIKLTSSN